ncbi:hypothetical protein CANCADRAFT_124424 [Tortispora caseinolytica NRRL Y-17796]|uniref:ENTH domain-containing protein n=1 Tax=Tortispora caseinolytica NRRL Y-17796 TaxID=767744 RepID=A0A1E4T9Y2_9ASCO|nr:hypothetical protein CANCADRAFT_124424 [Tortispora caseinolytica NRRL Y-17796]
MDQLKEQVSKISLYDVKAYVRKAQNVVMNYTEMEAKVREATNNEPWGASSTLMQDIAEGTYNYQQLTEIMTMIYRRFTEKGVAEWRQIYKALQLLEYLVKNGSERVVDSARSHMSTITMLKSFHYVHEGVDNGANVRNRAKELVDLLSDLNKVRAERARARANRAKYGGIAGGAAVEDSRQRRISSRTNPTGFGTYSGGVYGDGGGFGGSEFSSNYEPPRRSEANAEYDEYDAPTTVVGHSHTQPQPPQKQEQDLFSFDDTDTQPTQPSRAAVSAPAPATADEDDDDEFEEFQSASNSTNGVSATQSSNTTSSILDLFNTVPTATTTAPAASISAGPSAVPGAAAGGFPAAAPKQTAAPAASSKAKNDVFGDIWNLASKDVKKTHNTTQGPKGLAQMAQHKATQGMWGSPSTTTAAAKAPSGTSTSASKPASGALDDLLL